MCATRQCPDTKSKGVRPSFEGRRGGCCRSIERLRLARLGTSGWQSKYKSAYYISTLMQSYSATAARGTLSFHERVSLCGGCLFASIVYRHYIAVIISEWTKNDGFNRQVYIPNCQSGRKPPPTGRARLFPFSFFVFFFPFCSVFMCCIVL